MLLVHSKRNKRFFTACCSKRYLQLFVVMLHSQLFLSLLIFLTFDICRNKTCENMTKRFSQWKIILWVLKSFIKAHKSDPFPRTEFPVFKHATASKTSGQVCHSLLVDSKGVTLLPLVCPTIQVPLQHKLSPSFVGEGYRISRERTVIRRLNLKFLNFHNFPFSRCHKMQPRLHGRHAPAKASFRFLSTWYDFHASKHRRVKFSSEINLAWRSWCFCCLFIVHWLYHIVQAWT